MQSRTRNRNITKAARPTQKAMTMESAGTAQGLSLARQGHSQDLTRCKRPRAGLRRRREHFRAASVLRRLRKRFRGRPRSSSGAMSGVTAASSAGVSKAMLGTGASPGEQEPLSLCGALEQSLSQSLSLLEPGAAAERERADEAPMLVFRCAGCRRPVGDTASWVSNDEESGCILLAQ
ncbi:LOW QUALITY PROTEIN: protein Mis18-alpha [Geothlypis trichas]